MRITIGAIGRLKDGAERELFDRYAGRLDKAGRSVAIGPLNLVQHNESRVADVEQRQNDEADRLLLSCQSVERVVALDETGRTMTSLNFAKKLAGWRDGGVADVAFLIGGPDGHGQAVRGRADLVLALGAMTLPHGLARVVLAEQLYRAVTILTGHPYHRE